MPPPAELPASLEPSELGTKEYWDALYTRERRNHAADATDRGTVWFDDSDAEARTCALLAALAPPLDRRSTSFLDLGCGNGSLLRALRRGGAGDDEDEEDEEEEQEDDDDDEGGGHGGRRIRWLGPMLGVDYSAESVALARQIGAAERRRRRRRMLGLEEEGKEDGDGAEETKAAREEGGEDDGSDIAFLQHDVFASAAPLLTGAAQSAGWDVVLDKGTFDAVCLGAGAADSVELRYAAAALRLVREGGLFVVTSCNWTEEELEGWFARRQQAEGSEGFAFAKVARVEYRSFSFGGVKGQTISTVCFRKERVG